MKKIVSIIMCILCVVSFLPSVFVAQEITFNVNCGEKYEINEQIIIRVTTSQDIKRVTITNEDGSVYDCALAEKYEYEDIGNNRVWTLSKRAQIFGETTKEIWISNGDNNDVFLQSITYVVGMESQPDKNNQAFWHTNGQTIVEGDDDTPILLKGIALGNDVYSNRSTPPVNHHTEDTYRELSELGFNCVRFYLNYGIFEDDSNPYTYKQAGWDWLDWNVEMAKKYDVKLILNMHYPQGGYQSGGAGGALWSNTENQKRLAALWQEIAKRYSDEPAVGGYSLINEPIVPLIYGDPDGTINQLRDLMQTITDEIRKVDKNHMIFAERAIQVRDYSTGYSPWENSHNFNGQWNSYLLDDDNVTYEFHNYDPVQFTHQNASWTDYVGKFMNYPDEDYVIVSGNLTWMSTSSSNPRASNTQSDWQYLQGLKVKVTNTDYKAAQIALQAMNLGVNGKVWIDDVKLEEYDENGNFVRTMNSFDFSSASDISNNWSLWSADDSGSVSYDANEGYSSKGSVLIKGTTDDGNIGFTPMFIPVQGHSYEISGYVKVEDVSVSAQVKLRTDFWNCDTAMTLNKDSLENTLLQQIQFGKDNNVPMYLGEFGVIVYGFEQNRGGEQWVRDMLDLLAEHQVHFNYHTYHEPAFGLYLNNANLLPANRNQALYDIFAEKLNNM